MVKLIITRFDGNEEVFNPTEEITFLGRNDLPDNIINHINLPDSTVSRRHAKITFDNYAFFIEDLNSINGTYVNDKQINKAKLIPGDKITIGRNIIIFESEGTRTINPLDFVVKDSQINHHKTIDSNYFILQQLSKLVVTQTSLTDFLQAVIEMIMDSTKASRGVLMLTDPEGHPRQVVSAGGKVVYSEAVMAQVIAQKKSLLVGYDFEASGTMINRGVHAAICAPLLKDLQLLGVIYLEDPLPGKFGEEELVILTLFANQVAAGIENATLHDNLQKEFIIRSNLQRFLSPQVVDLVTQDCLAKGDLLLQSERVVATILFSDIKGFTLLSERLEHREVAQLINQHFSLMTEAIFSQEGTLDKYLGDGLVAVFGAPLPCADHALRAVRAGLRMLEEQNRYLESLAADKRFTIRIGINTGEVVAGYMGSPQRMEYSVLGEPVIIAQRLQTLAEPGSICLGKATFEAVKEHYPAEFVAKMETPKGRKEIEVYRLFLPR
jgi:adenylate cyclase